MTSALQRVQKITRERDREQQGPCEPRAGAACHMWDQGSVFEWLVACRVECTVSPEARSNPSCFSAADRVIGVVQLHTSDAKHLPPELLVTGVTKHDSNSRLKTWNITSYIKHYTATKEHSLLS